MISKTTQAILMVFFACGCDPAAPAPPALKAGAPPGILVVRPGTVPPELMKEAAYKPGLPSLGLKLEYPGPQLGLRVEAQGFEKGVSRASTKSHQVITLPLAADLGFGFGEGANSEGKVLAAVIEKFVTTSGSGRSTTRTGGVTQMGIPPIGARDFQMYEPNWPLEVADGKEAVVWGVFVHEPAGDRRAVPLMTRVKEAEAAWLFTIATGEKPKE